MMYFYTVVFVLSLQATLWNFSFCVDFGAPVDKGGSVSPNIRLHVPSVSLLAARRLLLWEYSSSTGDGPSVSG